MTSVIFFTILESVLQKTKNFWIHVTDLKFTEKISVLQLLRTKVHSLPVVPYNAYMQMCPSRGQCDCLKVQKLR